MRALPDVEKIPYEMWNNGNVEKRLFVDNVDFSPTAFRQTNCELLKSTRSWGQQ